MTELERVKEFMETLEFHGYIDHDSSKLKELIDDYYPKKEQLTIPVVSNSFCELFIPREKESSYCAKCEQHKIDH